MSSRFVLQSVNKRCFGTSIRAFQFAKPTTTYKSPISSVRTTTSTSTASSTSGFKKLSGYNKSITDVMGKNVLEDLPSEPDIGLSSNINNSIDWYTSWHGLGSKPFSKEIQESLNAKLQPLDIEIKPDGLIYLPEIKYRRILNKTFGAGGWGLVPRSETIVTPKLVTREYALVCHGQIVSIARGEQDYFNETGIPTATEGCKSNALMRCCKDLGIGSELWDPTFIKTFKKEYCVDKFVEHIATKKKKKIWLRKDRSVEYPYK
ncbi:hypothetical protein TBLA_0A10680 [Henningerozyma blattae CBS 6284]|uniref:Mitochondrial genome maintenance protein MGM101 n=1 Tax=Henningerozyma blattae (strain ATCC 34711 / CBS 6284 / DSM 70876 / NBRC 10599 / NRRL Y-10934 / UCD 77-7) TaxID=1071380 RepID=I2GXJ4_HENB6|nr:hypothetical protein TBLA_0A10680 [Tetrapisispora blattae CBS 6284]CCH58846.1 hypothetical protein TBLA_0A10680 [Tetrapisispora blattae CBS 6284]